MDWQASADVVVIGGGIAGLTAGAFLARAGRSVLVVEQHDRPGGYARALEADGYRFDPAVHLIMGGNPDGPFGQGLVDAALETLGVRDEYELIPVSPFYTACFPGLTLAVPPGREAFIAAHAAHFPAEADGLRTLTQVCAEVYQEFLRFPIRPRWRDRMLAPLRFPRLARYRNATLANVLRRHLRDPQLRSLYAALWSYGGLPPARLAFSVWAILMASYVEEGAFYCRGGFQPLADALAVAVQRHGGELRCGSRVEQIETRRGQVHGVRLADGRVTAPVVVATGDPRATFGHLLPPSATPAGYRRRLTTMELSMSVGALYLGTDLDLPALGLAHETVIARDWDPEAAYDAGGQGEITSLILTAPTQTEPSVAPPGHHQAVIMGRCSPAPSTDQRVAVADQLLSGASPLIPDLRHHLRAAWPTLPPDPQQIEAQVLGPIYGWATTPAQSGLRRLGQETPVPGLYLAGQWTQPGHGIFTAVASGVRAARLILQRRCDAGVLPLGL